MRIDGYTAERQLCQGELVAEALAHRTQDAQALSDDFRTNPVAAQHRNVSLHTRCS
jgi:hypothetical protein